MMAGNPADQKNSETEARLRVIEGGRASKEREAGQDPAGTRPGRTRAELRSGMLAAFVFTAAGSFFATLAELGTRRLFEAFREGYFFRSTELGMHLNEVAAQTRIGFILGVALMGVTGFVVGVRLHRKTH